jgi:hypothetical protein
VLSVCVCVLVCVAAGKWSQPAVLLVLVWERGSLLNFNGR